MRVAQPRGPMEPMLPMYPTRPLQASLPRKSKPNTANCVRSSIIALRRYATWMSPASKTLLPSQKPFWIIPKCCLSAAGHFVWRCSTPISCFSSALLRSTNVILCSATSPCSLTASRKMKMIRHSTGAVCSFRRRKWAFFEFFCKSLGNLHDNLHRGQAPELLRLEMYAACLLMECS